MTDIDSRAVFLILDSDDSGTLSPGEIRSGIVAAFGSASPSSAKIDQLFIVADADKSGFIDPEEFSAFTKALCSHMKITTNAFHTAITRSEITRIFDRLSIDDKMTRSDCIEVLTELCVALEAPVTAEALMRALDLSQTSREGASKGVPVTVAQFVTKAEFVTLLSELTQNRPSPALSQTFRSWEVKKREAIKNRKLGIETSSAGTVPGQSACTACEINAKKIQELELELNEATQSHLDQTTTQQSFAMAQSEAHEAALTDATNQIENLTATLIKRDDMVRDLQRKLEASNSRVDDLESENKALFAAQGRALSESKELSERLGQLSLERSRLQHQADVLASEMTKMKLIEQYFLNLEESFISILDSHTSAVQEIRERTITLQVGALKKEHHRIQEERNLVSERLQQVLQRQETATKHEEELQQREQLLARQMKEFAKIQRSAERTSLPEREHRMDRLQMLERQVCSRESQLQAREEKLQYLESIVDSSKLLVERIKQKEDEVSQLRRLLTNLGIPVLGLSPSFDPARSHGVVRSPSPGGSSNLPPTYSPTAARGQSRLPPQPSSSLLASPDHQYHSLGTNGYSPASSTTASLIRRNLDPAFLYPPPPSNDVVSKILL